MNEIFHEHRNSPDIKTDENILISPVKIGVDDDGQDIDILQDI